jgi:hypothetical protein
MAETGRLVSAESASLAHAIHWGATGVHHQEQVDIRFA